MIKRMLIASVTALLMVTLTACAGIPRAGGVHQGAALSVSDASAIEFFPAGPTENASPEQILRGFLEAASGPQNDYAVARQYLTPEFQTKWDPNAGVLGDSASRTIVMGAANTAVVSTTVLLTVDSTGQYRDITDGVLRTLNYGFTQVNGQWRLSTAPQGVLIDRGIFDLIYRTYPIYFFDPSYRFLVPDVRWFARASSATTRITKALLTGPAAWLGYAGAVANAFPAGTGLVANAVPVNKDVASVDLTSQVSAAEPVGLLRMKQQVTASLAGVNGVSSVELFVEGVPAAQNSPAYVDSVLPPPVDSRPFVLSTRGVGYLDGDAVTPSTAFTSVLTGTYSALTLGVANRYAVTLAANGVGLIRPGAGLSIVDNRAGLIAPSLDRLNFVWSVPRTSLSELHVISTDGTVNTVAVPWSASRVTALKVSHDGARVAVLYSDTSGADRLVVATILRNESGVPVKLGSYTSLPLPTGVPLDIAWADSTTVAVVASSASGSLIYADVIGGRFQSYASFVQGIPSSLSGGNNISQLRILATDGRLYSLRNNTTWAPLATGISVLGVQQ